MLGTASSAALQPPASWREWVCGEALPIFLIFHADGRVMFLEIKRSGGRLSEDQRRIADHMKRAGHAFEVVDNLEAAIAMWRQNANHWRAETRTAWVAQV